MLSAPLFARRTSRRTFALWIMVAIGMGNWPALSAAIYDLESGAGPFLRLNVPENLEIARGILIWGNGAGGDARARATDPELMALASSLDFAVLATSQWGNFSNSSEISIFESALSTFANSSNHPELLDAPWLPIGFSNGGQMSFGLNALRPQKVIAFAANKGGSYNVNSPSFPALTPPGLLIAGELDSTLLRNAIERLFDQNRPRGARWAWVEAEAVGHSLADSL